MLGTEDKKILRQLYINNLKGITSNFSSLTRQIECPAALSRSFLYSLAERESIIVDSENNIQLTDLGRKQLSIVMTGGTYDILHIGHLFTLEQAKLLGDVLVVVLATDNTVMKLKNHPPANKLDERAQVLESVRYVDAVVKGSETDFMSTVDLINPDIIALGYNQSENEKTLYKNISARNHSHVKIVRLQKYVPDKSTSRIFQDIFNHSYRK